MGVVIAVWMYSPRKRYRHAGTPTSIPYKGWKRWHTITGLFFGVVTTTWAFSGLLSMGPFPIMERLTDSRCHRTRGTAGDDVDLEPAMRGGALPLEAYAAKPPAMALASVREFQTKELEYTSYAGQPVYLATNGRGETRVIPVHGQPSTGFDPIRSWSVVHQQAGGRLAELTLMHEYDAYYLDRRGQRPLPVIYARLNDAVGTRYYIDPRTATIVERLQRPPVGEPLAVPRSPLAGPAVALQVPARCGTSSSSSA